MGRSRNRAVATLSSRPVRSNSRLGGVSRVRDFGDEAVLSALASGRLTIHFDVGESSLGECLGAEIKRARELGSRDVGVFAHSNAAVFDVGEVLNALGIDHALIGIPEAHAEALNAMAVEC